jgi:hypothetical protein
VPGVLAARLAEFLRLQPVGVFLAILGGRVVPVFAIVALQRNDFAHRQRSLWLHANSSDFSGLKINCENELPTNKEYVISILPPNSNPKPKVIRLLYKNKYERRIREVRKSNSQRAQPFLA